ncbi:MAG TPA: AAA family ATPase, partial [Candidatus Acidoferrum sp.]|nr:AAA family ATPase [Candidatus Acidoferrum sp.]
IPVRQHGRVLFFNCEVAEHVFQYRLRLMLKEAERRSLKTADARRQFFPVTVRGLLRLDRKAGEEAVLKLADQVKPLLIILDPIGPLHGWDENSADEMGRLLNLMLTFCAKTGAAVLFTHHAPKNTEGREEIHFGRGSSVFGDRVDSALSLVPSGEQGEGSRLKLGFILRNGPPRESLILWRGKDEFLYSAVGETEDVSDWLKGLLAEEQELPFQNVKERYEAAGHRSGWRLKKAIEALEKSGELHREKRGMPAKGYLVQGLRNLL